MTRTSEREIISTKRQKIANLASEAPEMVLTTLAHHIDLMWLKKAEWAYAQGRRGWGGRRHRRGVRS
ncbi:hypothetical protein U5801_23155 [Lamprobacter modestohalophilus]|uniref:hypothetical protein n=1 Tax=Lamprobacter modestohalophilus TaxID=1064514 RepID=UPI002ADEDAAF|nr:hypothetical protein [Lamprobacter modestohalophilus]MEA1052685.1 hypothetical protein [Lamprobacter modestohalophilus]